MTGGSVSARAETKEVQMTAKKYEFSPSSVEVPVGATVVSKSPRWTATTVLKSKASKTAASS